MKKTVILIGMLIMLAVNIFAVEIINHGKKNQISLEELTTKKMLNMETTLVKDGEPKNDKWQGIDLVDLLEENSVTDYKQLKFYSKDNYMVRLSKEEIYKYKPIIALHRNGKRLDEDHIRLVVKGMRDMFWIRGIANIETESAMDIKFPHNIIFAEQVFTGIESHDLAPFKEANGYAFSELISEIFAADGKFFIIGRDGVSHHYDYQNYLAKAVLIENKGKFDLKSVQMPGGMWIDDIAVILVNSKAIVFQNQFKNLTEIKELLQLDHLPANATTKSATDSKKISSGTEFSSELWKEVTKFVW